MSKKFSRNFKNFRNNNSNTLSEYEYRKNKYDLCTDCKQQNTHYNWCQNCNSKIFQHDFDKWTSGNKYIDKFIQETQLKARKREEVIEWIPYNRFRNIKYLSKGGFSTVYKAILLDGPINYWDNKAQTWSRFSKSLRYGNDHEIAKEKDVKSPLSKNEKRGYDVVLKSLNNSSNINDDFLNELKNHLQCVSSSRNSRSAVFIYGITQDPETSNYMMVMRFMDEGNLRSNLLIVKKYDSLMDVANALLILHKCNLVHGLRPKIVEGTLPAIYARLMKRCWDSDPNKRPTADELVEILSIWSIYSPCFDSNNRIPFPNNEPITKNHPLSCYTSRKIDYSAKLNEILTQEELSTKIVIDEERESKLLSESLESCVISD
ncbi:uncharacterized protein OCT59_027385 [Rhizophagus irregularis]|uniref:uncharacterized protein n=1 Tax=Rhizophagus irregularis TaxID=588596 RepID=UPI0033300C3F|nr:hypothetical protein OCT59_027385 [Rhizophagus irregularis]